MELTNTLTKDFEATKLRVLAHFSELVKSSQGLSEMQRTIDNEILELQIYKMEKFIFDNEKENFDMILTLFYKFGIHLRTAITNFYTSLCNQKEDVPRLA